MRVHWTERKSNQLILEEINPEYSLEGLMLKLKLQYLGHVMQTTDSLEKTLMLEKILESPLDHKEIQPVQSEGDQPWDSFEMTDAKAETPILWPPHPKS